ncbi:MAG: hypothetical protein ACR2PV_06575 [Gammaproteobacteria bacterium]
MKKMVILAMALGALSVQAGNDYPTEVRADYVFACMAVHGDSAESLRRCSCSIDVIAANLSFDEYVQAETVMRIRQAPGGEKYSLFRSLPWAEKIVDKLGRAQVEADLECFESTKE